MATDPNFGEGPSAEATQLLNDFWPSVVQQIHNLTPNHFKNQELPLARIKKIMKLDDDVKMISAEAPVLFAKAAEIFVCELSLRAWIHTEDNKRRTLQRNDIAMAISKYDQFDFLIDIVPRDELKPAKRQEETVRASSNLPDQIQYYLQLAQQQQQQQQQQQAQQQQQPTAVAATTQAQQTISQTGVQVHQPTVQVQQQSVPVHQQVVTQPAQSVQQVVTQPPQSVQQVVTQPTQLMQQVVTQPAQSVQQVVTQPTQSVQQVVTQPTQSVQQVVTQTAPLQQQTAAVQLPSGQIIQHPIQIQGLTQGVAAAAQPQMMQLHTPQTVVQSLGQMQQAVTPATVQQQQQPAQQQTAMVSQVTAAQPTTQVYQQVITPSGEVQGIPIQLTPQQLQSIQMQLQGNAPGQSIVIQSSQPMQGQPADQLAQLTAGTQSFYQIQQLPQQAQHIFIQQAEGDEQAEAQET